MKNNDNLENILRSQAPFDESLHSFLLRIIWNYDPTIKPIGIIHKLGGLVDRPFCHKSIEHLFRQFPDHILLEIIDINKTINGIDNSLFDNPANYSLRIKHTFSPNRNIMLQKQRHKIVKYCLECINESIKSFGYGYLKSFWDIDDKCLIHHSSLKNTPLTDMKKTIRSLKLIMKGIEPEDSSEINIQQRKHGDLAYPDKCLTEKYLFPIKFADCIMLHFAIWIIKNIDNFKSNDLKNIAFKLGVNYINCNDRCNIENDLLFKKRFMYFHLLCSSEAPDILSGFYLNHVEFLELYLGPREEGVLKEIYSKSKENKCSTCNFKLCTIKNGTTNKPLSREKISHEFLFNNSYTLRRVVMQGKPIIIIASEPWAPIDVSIKSKI